MSGPNKEFIKALAKLRVNLVGATSAVLEECGNGYHERFIKALDVMNDGEKSVRGNRPGSSLFTWSDCRLTLAAAMRLCLEELEKGPCQEPDTPERN